MFRNELEKRLKKITPNNRAMILAYDQGFEHGPRDFKDNPLSADHGSADPGYIIDVAKKGGFTGLVLHAGIAEAYQPLIEKSEIPLILKLNGKSELYTADDPYSPQLYSVHDAFDLGATAVGYTVYPGSKYENQMNQEFAEIIREAHRRGMPAIGWMYPRGKCIDNDAAPEIVAYGARIGLELGADIVKVKYTGSVETFRWVVECAQPTKVVMSGGPKTKTDKEFLKIVKEILEAGAVGIAVGRNVWQRKNSLEISKKLKELILL